MKRLLSLLTLPVIAFPLLAQQGTDLNRAEKEKALGQMVAAKIRSEAPPVANAAIESYVQRVGSELAAQLKDSPHEFQFEAISGGSWTEPVPVIGGFVFVPLRLLAAVQDEAEFAGVLTHAIGHVALRHGARPAAAPARVVNTASLPLIYTGPWAGVHAESGGQLPSLVPVGLRQEQRLYELEADRFGVELAARSGFDPSAFQRYVERTHRKDATAVSPLPSREVRIASLQEAVSALPVSPRLSRSAVEFQQVQAAARAILNVPSRAEGPPTLRR